MIKKFVNFIKDTRFYRIFIKRFLLLFFELIQWTKKWHVCHVIINCYAISFYILLFFCIYSCIFIKDGTPFWDNIVGLIVISDAFLYYILYFALFIVLLISILEHIKEKKIFVKNKFLLNNTIYNKHYHCLFILIFINLSFLLFSSLFYYCLLFIILYAIIFILFLIIKIIITNIIDVLKKSKLQ